ncbi:MAG: FAD/NAD(P)-binding protein [Desulfobaccales bacterium]
MTPKPGEMSLDNPAPMLPEIFQVKRVQRETADTFTLEMTRSGGSADFAFVPGQFNMLYAFRVGEVPISISGDPAHPGILVHTLRNVGNVTRAICKSRPGAQLGVRGPFGASWPVAAAAGNDVIIVAGGLGLAPLRPALYHILSHRRDYGNIELIYGARTSADLLYRRELERWRGRFDVRVHVSVDTAAADWKGSVGVVTTVIPRARFDSENTTALVCGPQLMMRYTLMELLGRGLAPAQIFVSMERHMKCGLGLCGHCQWGPFFVCKDGPVFRYDKVLDWFERREV